MIEDYFKQNTIYLQIRTTVKTLHKGGDLDAQMTANKTQYLSAILQAINQCESKYPTLTTRLIVSIDRSRGQQQANQNFDLLKQFKSQNQLGKKYLVGLELSGNPMVNRFSEYEHLFQKARDLGLKVSIHTAQMGAVKEDQSQDTDDILKFKPDRLGHCTHASQSQLQKIWELNIPVEICPTSNYNTMQAKSFKDLKHFQYLWEKGVKDSDIGRGISLCCDDTGLFGTNLTSEIFEIAQNFQISAEQLSQNQLKVVENCIFQADKQVIDRLNAEIMKFKNSV